MLAWKAVVDRTRSWMSVCPMFALFSFGQQAGLLEAPKLTKRKENRMLLQVKVDGGREGPERRIKYRWKTRDRRPPGSR
jgi:hypothetical protein